MGVNDYLLDLLWNPDRDDGRDMSLPGAPRCEDCGGDLDHSWDFQCWRCWKASSRRHMADAGKVLSSLLHPSHESE